jgi:endoglucanase
MKHHSRTSLYLGLVVLAWAAGLGCNSHLLLPSGDPQVVVIDPPPVTPPPPPEPGRLGDAGEIIPPLAVEPQRDAAIPDGPAVVPPTPDATVPPEPASDAAVVPDAAPDQNPDGAPDASPDLRPDSAPDLRPDTLCPRTDPPVNFPATPTCEGTEGGLGEAFQKALWFLNVNKSGPGVINTYVQWRGDAHVMDAHIKLDPNAATGVDMSQAFITKSRPYLDKNGTGEVDLSGGFHDAGDFIKFGLTTGFTGSTLAWSMYEYPDAYQKAGLMEEAQNLLRWADDYFIRCAFLDGTGNLIAFAHQVGDQTDHTCGWMPPELRRSDFCPRKGYFATADNPAADVTASAAASLALSSLVFRAADAAYADKSLKYATALYSFARKYPTAVANTTGGLYTSEYAYDDLAWAAVWLYIATGTQAYLDDILGPNAGGGGWLDGFPGFKTTCLASATASCWAESATHDWNSVRTGVFLKLAQVLRDNNHPMAKAMQSIARGDSMKWPDGTVAQTPAGFSVLYAYGSARYNSAAQFVALLYAKLFGADDSAAVGPIQSWAKMQMAYILGQNPLNTSYMMGYTDKYCSQPHHAAGHASIWGQPNNPVQNRHIIWGALVNGPDGDDNHVDNRADFGSNEVTIDYNVSLIAALAAQYSLWGDGQCPLRVFPTFEPDGDEFYTLSGSNGGGSCRSQVTVTLVNETQHVPRYDTHVKVRYFFDISELQAKGGGIGDVTASLIYDRGATEFGEPTSLSKPTVCPKSSSTYYVDMGFEGYLFWGRIVQLKAPRTFQLDLGVNNTANCTWNATNDWSYAGLSTMPADGSDPPKTPHIVVYSGASLVFGQEPPGCFSAPTPTLCP